MVRVPVGASRGLRWGCLSLAAVVALLAHHDRSRRRALAPQALLTSSAITLAQSYNPPYAAIVVDAKTGAVLHQSQRRRPRHPASLTKIMTLYLLFERLEAGKITLDTPMAVSEEAAIAGADQARPASPAQTIEVEDAIKGAGHQVGQRRRRGGRRGARRQRRGLRRA